MTGTDVKRIRESLELTQAEFGSKLGVTNVAVSLWESNKRAIAPMTVKMIRLLEAGKLDEELAG